VLGTFVQKFQNEYIPLIKNVLDAFPALAALNANICESN
jgi:hypothetical protein